MLIHTGLKLDKFDSVFSVGYDLPGISGQNCSY